MHVWLKESQSNFFVISILFSPPTKNLPISPVVLLLTQEKFAHWSKSPGYATDLVYIEAYIEETINGKIFENYLFKSSYRWVGVVKWARVSLTKKTLTHLTRNINRLDDSYMSVTDITLVEVLHQILLRYRFIFSLVTILILIWYENILRI
jgi:hypothetical protein